MYFFYLDESGSRDPSAGTPADPKDHIYVLLAVGMYERQWRPFDREVSQLKLELAGRLRQEGVGPFDLADCEAKSSWLRAPRERRGASRFFARARAGRIATNFRSLFWTGGKAECCGAGNSD